MAIALALVTRAIGQNSGLPQNLDSHLQDLLKERSAVGKAAASQLPGAPSVDSQDRVRVRVLLTGKVPAGTVAQGLLSRAAAVDPFPAENPDRVLVASVPVDQLATVASIPGVQSVLLFYSPKLAPPVPKPNLRPLPMDGGGQPSAGITGQAPSQASGPIGVTALSGRFDGTGQVIAIISDTYNLCTSCSKREADDIATNNLPGPGNPAGNTTPVTVVAEGTSSFSDEGRAMMQLVYGIAPKAKYCFATGFSNFSANVAALYKPVSAGGLCGATVIIDDVGFQDAESDFGDGTSPSRAVMAAVAAGVTYLSSAGNSRGLYDGTWNPVSDAMVRGGSFGNLNFSNVPASLTAGGFQNFSTTGVQQISFSISTQRAIDFVLQWNDPFDPAGITSDYNLLVFDANGNYVPSMSSVNVNTSTGTPVETSSTPKTQASAMYQFVISAASNPGAAQRLRIVPNKDADQYSVAGLSSAGEVPAIYGHPAAPGVIGTAAYSYQALTTPEIYSSGGPFYNYFDNTGARLSTPEVRQQPLLAGFDDVDTTYFGSDSDGDGFPNFAGTSAAAPTAGGVAALILQASGGTATPAQIASYLQQSASHAATWSAKDGYGFINALKAANAVSGTASGTPTTTVLTASANPAPPNVPVTLTATVRSVSAERSGVVEFFDGNTRLGAATLHGDVASITIPTLRPGGHMLAADYGGDDDDQESAGTLEEAVSDIDPDLVWLHSSSISVGTDLSNVLTASAQDQTEIPVEPVMGSYSYLIGTTQVTASTILPAGTYTLTVVFTPNDLSTYNKVSSQSGLVVTKGSALIAFAPGTTNAFLQSNVVLSLAFGSAAVAPTGTVIFYDGKNSLGSTSIANGYATFSTNNLAVGSHSISAAYSGDTNFNGETTSVVTIQVTDFSLSTASSVSSQTTSRGGTATYNLSLSVSGGGTLPSTVNLSVSGLPAGATYSFSPSSIASGSGTAATVLTITVPQQLAMLERKSPVFGLTFAAMLLPLSFSVRRRGWARSAACFTLLFAGFGLVSGVCGCASNSSSDSRNTSFTPQTFTVTVTGTGGTLNRSTNLTLIVQ